MRRRFARLQTVLVGLVVVALSPAQADASPGDIDPLFSGDGFLPTPMGFEAMALQPDGKFVVGFDSTNPEGPSLTRGIDPPDQLFRFVARMNPDGTFDSGFGDGGLARLPGFTYNGGENFDIAVQSNGRILVTPFGGGGTTGFGLIGLTPDGQLDPSFGGGDGIVRQEIEREYIMTTQVEIGPDGGIVLAGRSTQPIPLAGYAVAKLLPDGEFDPSFSGDGWTVAGSVKADSFGPHGLAVRPDGRIVVGGAISALADRQSPLLALQFTADGELDPTFSADGVVVQDTFASPNASGTAEDPDMALDSQGRLVMSASRQAYVKSTGGFRYGPSSIVRFGPDGELDPTFGEGGIAILRRPSFQAPNMILFSRFVLDAADRPILIGEDLGVRLVRLTEHGTLDTSFSGDGWAAVHLQDARLIGGIADLEVVGDRLIAPLYAFLQRPRGATYLLARFELGDGPADLDGDGVENSAEACAEIHGECPILVRNLPLRYRPENRTIVGAVRGRGGDLGCFALGRLKLYETQPGEDRLVASANVGRRSNFRFALSEQAAGGYFVRATKVDLPYGVCQETRSRRVVVPR